MHVSLNEHLRKNNTEDGLRHLITSIANGAKYVHHAMQTGDLGLAGTSNMYGEDQLTLDVLTNDIFVKELQESCQTCVLASEELDDVLKTPDTQKGRFAVAFDPLDGSSLVNANLAIGSIFGIYEGDEFIGKTGEEQLASVVVIYGPRVTLLYTTRNGVHEFILNAVGEFILSQEDIKVDSETRIFAPGNLRAIKSNKKYAKVVENWMSNQYKLRYSGGMVPDINHIFMKGQGVFAYPGHAEAPQGKLRLLYECAPFALLMEEAGGRASDGEIRILELAVEKLDHRTPIFIGSDDEVKKIEEMFALK